MSAASRLLGERDATRAEAEREEGSDRPLLAAMRLLDDAAPAAAALSRRGLFPLGDCTRTVDRAKSVGCVIMCSAGVLKEAVVAAEDDEDTRGALQLAPARDGMTPVCAVVPDALRGVVIAPPETERVPAGTLC